MKSFTVKATRQDPTIECTYHIECETKDEAEVSFKKLLPDYEITKVREKEEPK